MKCQNLPCPASSKVFITVYIKKRTPSSYGRWGKKDIQTAITALEKCVSRTFFRILGQYANSEKKPQIYAYSFFYHKKTIKIPRYNKKHVFSIKLHIKWGSFILPGYGLAVGFTDIILRKKVKTIY